MLICAFASSYCMTEFETAYCHNVAAKRKTRLIVLTMLDQDRLKELKDGANDAGDTASLRQYLRQYTYIRYPADDWLHKLLYALPLRGLLPRDGNDDDDVQLLHCN